MTLKQTQPIPFEEAEHYLKHLKGQDLLLWSVMLYTGRRFSDCARFRWEDISGNSFIIKEKKTGKKIKITLNPKLVEILNQNKKDAGYVLHPKKNPMQKLTVWGANKRVKEICDLLRIDTPVKSTHMLRKTFAKHVFLHHGITVTAHILNHSSEAVTRRYIGLTDEVISDVFISL